MKLFYYLFSIIIFFLAIFCIVFPNDMISATQNGITLWFNVVLPSLLPFLIISDLIQKTATVKVFSKLLEPIMKPVFNLPGISSLAIFLGFTGGYPIGAKTTADLRKNNSISRVHARRLLAFSNNSGPLFISGAVGIGIYQNFMVSLLLLLSHYLSALIVGILFRFYKKNQTALQSGYNIHIDTIKISELGSLLSDSIKKAFTIVSIVGGFIVLFSIIISILEKCGLLLVISKALMPYFPLSLSGSILSGILEVTNGVSKLASLNCIGLFEKLIITSSLISFGGISIHLQTLSVISDSDIGISTYLMGKTLQGIFSGVLTFVLLYFSSFSSLITRAVFVTDTYNTYGFTKLISTITILFLFVVIFKIIQVCKYK